MLLIPPVPVVPPIIVTPTTVAQFPTLQQGIDELAARLADPNKVRYVEEELTDYLIEALRVWNAATGYFRDSGVFQTVPNQSFYDLASTLPSLRGYHVTDRDLVRMIEYQLLEPATPTVWTGSSQFDLHDIIGAIQRRRDAFLLETGMVLTRTTQGLPPTPGGRQPLAQTVIGVRRAAWRTTDGLVTPLHREDVWNFGHFKPAWVQSPGRPPQTVPFGYSVGETPPLVIQVAPPNSDTGTLDLVTVSRGASLDPMMPVLMGVCDDWCWVIRCGALADLLSKDGLSMDMARASYFQQRWEQGIQIAKTASVVWDARVLNAAIQVGSLTEADDFDSGWQSRRGQPDTVLVAGGTLIALADVPDAGPYSVTLDLVRNAPIPASDQQIPVGEEVFSVLLDLAEHTARSKEGFPDVQETMPLFQRFMRLAGVQVGLDLAQTPNLSALTQQSQQDEIHTARMVGANG